MSGLTASMWIEPVVGTPRQMALVVCARGNVSDTAMRGGGGGPIQSAGSRMGTRGTVPPAGTWYRARMYLGGGESLLFNLLGKLA